MPMYNLIEYSDNYSDTSGSLWQFKRDDVPADNADLNPDNFQSFKYKAALVRKTIDAVNHANSSVKSTKIVAPLKNLSNFWRSLEMTLINCKILLELRGIQECVLSSDGNSEKFKIADAKLHVPIVTLSTKHNIKMKKQLSNEFKRSVSWKCYQIIPAKVINQGTKIHELLSASFQGIKRLFVLAYVIDANAVSNEAGIKNKRKYFLPRGRLKILTY